MNVVSIYARIYGDALKKSFRAIRKNLWTLLLPMGVGLAANAAVTIVGGLRLGILSGIIISLIFDALFSAYLYFVGELVSDSKVSLNELKRSFGAYFWALLNLFFVFWIANFLLSALLRGQQGALLLIALSLVAGIAFNAAPEVIYQRGTHGGLQTLQESWSFLKSNWLPWFVPNGPLLALLFLYAGTVSLLPAVISLGTGLMLGPLLHVVFLFRGFLFKELAGTSHRQRMYRYRMGL